ncbi:hypothetical protein, partial [Bradyrhizobium sp.]|uniref:hypothetical protein n=1 Tax=Bradyrhizobium sp. TaxID=376 RepID=UPI00290251B8
PLARAAQSGGVLARPWAIRRAHLGRLLMQPSSQQSDGQGQLPILRFKKRAVGFLKFRARCSAANAK